MAGPNIFQYATSELSQDAIIAWLVLWSDKMHRNSNTQMALCGDALINRMLSNRSENSVIAIEEVKVRLQWKSIDLLIEINGSIVIAVEDKTISGEHSDQLDRYKRLINEEGEFQIHQKHFVYLKTYNQCRTELKTIKEEKGWHVIMRHELQEILVPYSGNHILLDDFLDHLKFIETRYDFKRKTFGELKADGAYWIGMYESLMDLEPPIGIKWHRVNNPNGGFWNLLLNWPEIRNDEVLYLQLEEHFLHVKLKIPIEKKEDLKNNKESRKASAISYRNTIMNHKNRPKSLTKTSYKSGLHMTLARIDIATALGGDIAIVDLTKFAALLREILTWFAQLHKEIELNRQPRLNLNL